MVDLWESGLRGHDLKIIDEVNVQNAEIVHDKQLVAGDDGAAIPAHKGADECSRVRACSHRPCTRQ